MPRDEIPPGTLYLLILKTLARLGEMHGYEIANSMQRISDDVGQVEEGSLYPALQRMLIKGWVTAKWSTTAGNRRARTINGLPRAANNWGPKCRRSNASWERSRVSCEQFEGVRT